jgi:hypothetical protein
VKTTRSTFVVRFGVVLSVATVAVLALAGCSVAGTNPTIPVSSTGNSDGSSSPTAPAQVFGGKCSALFSAKAVGSALGTHVSVQSAAFVDQIAAAPATRGGIYCQWNEGTASNTVATLYLALLSTKSVASVSKDEIYCYGSATRDATTGGECGFSKTAGEYWISGVAYTPLGTTNATTRTAISRLLATFGARATVLPVPKSISARPGEWSHVESCAALSASSGIPALLKSPGLKVQRADDSPAEQADGLYSAISSAGIYDCAWFQPATTAEGQVSGLSAAVFPGGGWAFPHTVKAHGTRSITVPAAQHAYEVTDSFGVTIDAFDGVNWLEVNLPASVAVKQRIAVVSALLKHLDATV